MSRHTDISVSLPQELLDLIEAKVSSGRYTNMSEVVREALRVFADTEERNSEVHTRLRQEWDEGTRSGDAGALDFAALKVEARGRQMTPRKD